VPVVDSVVAVVVVVVVIVGLLAIVATFYSRTRVAVDVAEVAAVVVLSLWIFSWLNWMLVGVVKESWQKLL